MSAASPTFECSVLPHQTSTGETLIQYQTRLAAEEEAFETSKDMLDREKADSAAASYILNNCV